MRMLIGEEDVALATLLARGLEGDGHDVQVVTDGCAAVDAFRLHHPDLTILDLNLPRKDGEHALEEIRRIDPDLPVLLLSGPQAIDVRVRCFDLGADDLVLKPFSLHELRARCRALLRRKRDTRLVLRIGNLELDRVERTVKRDSRFISLTNKEFALLEHLMLKRGLCVSRVELLDSVWKMEPAQTTNIVDVYVNYLRRKLEDHPPGELVRTVRGKGYMMVEPPSLISINPADSELENVL